MTRKLNTESLAVPSNKKVKKDRNYSFRNSSRLPTTKMTQVNGVLVPSMPGSCYHAIIYALSENKDKFCTWNKLHELTHKNMCMFGGEQAWNRFINNGTKSFKQRIKINTHTLTRTGKDCYGRRLHEQGMCIYYFKDGVMLITGGVFEKKKDGSYNVVFPDGKELQTRYRGTTMTFKEYKKFLERGVIDASGKILDIEGIKKLRCLENELADMGVDDSVHICVTLDEGFDQNTADRLEEIGFVVEEAFENELIGTIPKVQLSKLEDDPDVVEVEVS